MFFWHHEHKFFIRQQEQQICKMTPPSKIFYRIGGTKSVHRRTRNKIVLMTPATTNVKMTWRTPTLLYDTTNENDLNDSGKITFLYESRNKIYLYDSRNDNGFNDSSK